MNLGIAIFVPITACALLAQPAFEVASIKSSNQHKEMLGSDDIRSSPGSLTMNGVTVASCLKWAYKIQDQQISGPDWIRQDRFAIVAKAGEPAADDQLRLMPVASGRPIQDEAASRIENHGGFRAGGR